MWNSGGDLREWPRSRLTRANISYTFATRKFRQMAREKKMIKSHRRRRDRNYFRSLSLIARTCDENGQWSNARVRMVTSCALAKLMSFAKFLQLEHCGWMLGKIAVSSNRKIFEYLVKNSYFQNIFRLLHYRDKYLKNLKFINHPDI